ncbi:hypothetical protein RND71_043344 [Anisodus tanguticus]|uniref:USP domain-containing protein n=1 Tax=Anisodus tanguticus TaxID=243964 RepID=A0AAE1QSN2_9SOLA|nr:hypothetical protein RND71_043344 [Anisodus tanguticus]
MKQFSDFNQHDALEYMEHFLDLLHEDMNRVDRTKPIVDEPLSKEEDSFTDSELADIMWKRNLKLASQVSKSEFESNNENDINSSTSNSDLDSSRHNLSLESCFNKQENSLNDTIKENIEIKVEPFYVNNKKVRCVRKVETMNEFNESNFNIYHTKLANKFHELKKIDEEDDENNQSFIDNLKDSDCLVMQWRDDPSSNFRTRIFCKDLDCSTNFYEYLNQFQEKTTTTLEDCLKIFTDKEILSLEDSWYCPKCKKPQKACKQLTIWRLPEILIIHLKRFSYKHCTRDKIDNFIEFPLYGLDLKNFCSSSQRNLENKTIYDLFAVINHFGGIYGGHYTATAKTVFQNKEYGVPGGPEKGYSSLTGNTQHSPGLVWYINGLMSPILYVRRGVTYTFRVEGGLDPTNISQGKDQAGILVWTPDGSTPDIVYYQSYTQQNMGWKIVVLDDFNGAAQLLASSNTGELNAI